MSYHDGNETLVQRRSGVNHSSAQPKRIGTGNFVEDYLLYLLSRVSHVLSGEFHNLLRRRHVSVPVWRVLASLSGSKGETVTGLAEVCLLQQPTMTKLLDRMVRDGLVTRAQDARDRRVVRVALTAEGESLAAELITAARQHEAAVLARFPELEAMDLKASLRAVLERETKSHPV
jgi:MarR family transcriptional regulator, organic hydroperoxide resistance regulator